jgi:hypothetical protein
VVEDLTADLASSQRKLEEVTRRCSQALNDTLVGEAERDRLLEALKVNDVKVEKLTKGLKDLRSSLLQMQKAKTIVEEQLVKFFKKIEVAGRKQKPTDQVNKNRPSSSSRKKGDEGTMKRNRSREEVSAYEELGDFLEFNRKKKTTGETKGTAKPSRLELSDDQGSGEEERSVEYTQKSRRRTSDQDSTPRSKAPSDSSPPRKASYRHEQNRQEQSPSSTSSPRRKAAITPKADDSSSVATSSSHPDDVKPVKGNLEASSPRKLTTPQGLPKGSSSKEASTKRETRGTRRSSPDNPWEPRIDSVEEDVNEEDQEIAEGYIPRRIESFTTTSSEEGLIERTVINEQGEVITLLNKKLDTRHFKLVNVAEYSKGVQFDFEEPEMHYAKDGTAITKDGHPRFYLPFNPNVVFGLKGDVFYHTLFQVFQAKSRVSDESEAYMPPYKLAEAEERLSVSPRKPPPVKRSPKKPVHSEGCGANCKHLTKVVRPKVREDMVLVLKKQDLVI